MNLHRYACFGLFVLCSAGVAAQEPLLFENAVERQHVERITSPVHTWHLETGDNLDMDNSATRLHGTWEIAFQNNIALEIANVGEVPVENPRVVANDRGRFHTWQAMLAEFTEGAKSDQERVYLIWEGLRQHRHHDYPLFADDEYHDPVRFLNIYGGGFCDDAGMVGSALYYVAGFEEQPPFVRALHGHMMCEVWHDGDFQFMDIDQDTFYLDWYNQKPVSGNTVAADHYLAMREQAYGPALQPWDQGPVRAAALFGRDDGRSGRGVVGHALDYTLRPGERVVFRWDERGKYPWQRQDTEHRFYGNSQLIYALPAAHLGIMPGTRQHGLEVDGDELVAKYFSPRLDIEVHTPYTIAGATLRFTWEDPTRGGVLSAQVARAGEEFTVLRTIETNGGEAVEEVALDEALGIAGGSPCRSYTVRLAGLDVLALRIRDIVVETDLYAYPIALPRLQAGDNVIEYTDETDAPHAVEIRWHWREAEALQGIPAPPASPEHPAHAAVTTGTTVPFAWPAVAGAERYWLRLSREPHMRYPYRPNYDVYLETNTYEVPHPGMFNHGETYYWQVRARRNGVWGAWSPQWKFTWEGPMPPVNVRIEEADGDAYLIWAAKPAAPPPAQYQIHSANVRGAAPGAKPIIVSGDTTRLRVARSDGVHEEGLHAAFYRVSAVDDAGVVSGPSPQASLPRPLIYGMLASPIAAGTPFEQALHVVASKGDMQFRYVSPPPEAAAPVSGLGWWEAESAEMSLLEGPDWISLTASPGNPMQFTLGGTPPADAVGAHTVTLRAVLTHPNEVGPDVQGAEAFRRYLEEPLERTQSFTLHVQ